MLASDVSELESSVSQVLLSGQSTPAEAATTTTVATAANASTPATSAPDECAKCVLSDTVKPYVAHLIVCDSRSASVWPKRVEEEEPTFVNAFSAAMDAYVTNQSPGFEKEIKLTCCEFNAGACSWTGASEHQQSIIVYPLGRILSFDPTSENIAALLSEVFSTAALDTTFLLEAITSLTFITVASLPWSTLFLVCAHANRDKRCGRAGPQVIEHLNLAIQEQGLVDEVRVLPSSHIGGHAFAGTLVVYPSGNWYGHISKANTKLLLHNVLNEVAMPKCFRGNGLQLIDF